MTNNSEPDPAFPGISIGRKMRPIFGLIYGIDGVGKSTFASQAPDPIFIVTDPGADHLPVARLPVDSLGQFRDKVKLLTTQPHSYRTIVVDHVTALQPMVWRQVCAEGKVKSIELYADGFGKGYVRALEIWDGLLGELLVLARKHHVLLIGHCTVKKFDDPTQPAGYDRYQVSLKENLAALIRQKCDVVLFANFVSTVKNIQGNTGKATGEGIRRMYTENRPAFDAKNRYKLPFAMALEWKPFGEAIHAFYAGARERLEAAPKPAEPTPEPAAREPEQPTPEPQTEPEPTAS
jgi:AAA domain